MHAVISEYAAFGSCAIGDSGSPRQVQQAPSAAGCADTTMTWMWILALIVHVLALWAMWWSGRHRGRADSAIKAAEAWEAATNGWETARTACSGLGEVIACDDLVAAKAIAIKASIKSMHNIATADEISANTGAPLEFVDRVVLEILLEEHPSPDS